MPLLIEVKHVDGDGLVGILENGKQIPLNPPTPLVYHARNSDLVSHLNEIAKADEQQYYQIGKKSHRLGVWAHVLGYNLYVPRPGRSESSQEETFAGIASPRNFQSRISIRYVLKEN